MENSGMILRIGGYPDKMLCCLNKIGIFGSFFNFFNQFVPVRYFMVHFAHIKLHVKLVYKTFGKIK